VERTNSNVIVDLANFSIIDGKREAKTIESAKDGTQILKHVYWYCGQGP
jgi:hypothetical protein